MRLIPPVLQHAILAGLMLVGLPSCQHYKEMRAQADAQQAQIQRDIDYQARDRRPELEQLAAQDPTAAIVFATLEPTSYFGIERPLVFYFKSDATHVPVVPSSAAPLPPALVAAGLNGATNTIRGDEFTLSTQETGRRVEPGHYRLVAVRDQAFHPMGMLGDPESIGEFDVKPGEIVYLGRYHMDITLMVMTNKVTDDFAQFRATLPPTLASRVTYRPMALPEHVTPVGTRHEGPLTVIVPPIKGK